MSQKSNQKFGIISFMIILAAMSRLLPHPPNFTALGALCLFGAAYYSRNWLALAVPVLAFWLSDLVLNNVVYAEYYEGFTLFTGTFAWSALAIAVMVLFGRTIMQKVSAKSVLGGTLGVSLIFFVISNFGSWASGAIYPMNGAGLLACYTAAIPFFLNSLLGNLLFSAVMFGSYELILKKSPALELS